MGTNLCLASEIPIRSQAGAEWTFEVRVFNDGAGFRYRVPGTGTRRSPGSPPLAFAQRQQVWFQTDTANYEGVYQSTPADQVPLDQEVEERSDRCIWIADGPSRSPRAVMGWLSEAALYNLQRTDAPARRRREVPGGL